MLHYIAAFLAAFMVAAPIAIKAATGVGVFGTALESFGLFLQKFSRPSVQSGGRFFVRVGKTFEAIGVDVPKIVSNALAFAPKLTRLIGLPGIVALIAFCASAVSLACAAPIPCPVAPQVSYAAALHEACPNATTIAELEACPAYAGLKASHQADQEYAGCRVK